MTEDVMLQPQYGQDAGRAPPGLSLDGNFAPPSDAGGAGRGIAKNAAA
jgi:hypothetical protein